MGWTPALGAKALARRLGPAAALSTLAELLSGEVAGSDLLAPGAYEALLDIGDGHAARLMDDPTGERLAHWPRSWAARAMAYLGDPQAAPALLAATYDHHWRVRMTAVQSLGRLGVEGHTDRLAAALDDAHPRVREAAVVALGRVGGEDELAPLAARRSTLDPERVDRAIAAIDERAGARGAGGGRG